MAEPLSDLQRLVLQNFFDTQPAKRKAYLKQLGFEMDEKDDNKYRPIDSKGYYNEIDPGFGAYFKKGGLKELGKDFGDIGFDTLSGMLSAATASKGAAAGAAVGSIGTPVLSAVLGTIGLVAGGAIGNAAAEALKNEIADIYLDDNIPMNLKDTAVQSLITGAMPVVFKGLKQIGKEGAARVIRARKEAIINAAKSSGGGITPELLEKAAKDPDLFKPENTAKANQKLTELYDNFFGRDPIQHGIPDDIKAGDFGKKIAPLNKLANDEMDRLASDPRANFKVSEIADPMLALKKQLESKFDRSAEEQSALEYLTKKLKYLDEKTTVKGPGKTVNVLTDNDEMVTEFVDGKISNRDLSFKEGREFLSAIQSDVFKKDKAGNYITPGASYLASAVGGSSDGLRTIIDKKALSVGSSLPQINQQRHNILKAYNEGVSNFKPDTISRAFLGNDSDAKQKIKNSLDLAGEVLGVDKKNEIETLVNQRTINELYRNPGKAFGSGRVNADIVSGMVSGGLKGTAAGGAAGYAVGGFPGAKIGATIGGVSGAAMGAKSAADLSSPEKALQALGNISMQERQLSAELATPAAQVISRPVGAMSGLASVEAGKQYSTMPKQDEIDLSDISFDNEIPVTDDIKFD